MSHQPRQIPLLPPSAGGRHPGTDGGQEQPEASWWRSKPAVVVWVLIVLFTLAGILGHHPEGPVGTASCKDPTGDIEPMVEPVDQPAAEQPPGLDLTGIDLHARGDDLVITWEAAGAIPRDAGANSWDASWWVEAVPDDGDPITFAVQLIGGTFYAYILNLMYLDPFNRPLAADPIVDGSRLTHVFRLDEIELPERFRWRGGVHFGEVYDPPFFTDLYTDLCPDEDETGPGRFPG